MGLTEQRPERPPSDFASRQTLVREERGSERTRAAPGSISQTRETKCRLGHGGTGRQTVRFSPSSITHRETRDPRITYTTHIDARTPRPRYLLALSRSRNLNYHCSDANKNKFF
ncbi:hypothetical protein PUN28_008955 [Cardiocondyla obscurior]|uniref:Uncharacterized protein n=1 Tax=Cardiocondyla obscurior TaxID=286306 RepID=A0AAW2FRJ1_9HYME